MKVKTFQASFKANEINDFYLFALGPNEIYYYCPSYYGQSSLWFQRDIVSYYDRVGYLSRGEHIG